MVEDVLLIERKGSICTLSINRPERRNALTAEVLLKLGDTLNSLKDDGETRVVILRGAGEKSFSAGMDLIEGSKVETTQAGASKPDILQYATESILACPCPVIAMIYGYALASGCDLAVACDLRLAADTAKIGVNPAKLGLVYSRTVTQRFINLVGVSRTKELFFTGRYIDAPKAKEIGLIDHVVPEGQLAATTYALAREIADNAPLAVSATKSIINRLVRSRRLSDKDESEIRVLIEMVMKSKDLEEGFKAFSEKRKPDFKGR